MFVCKDTFYISSTSQVSLPKKVQLEFMTVFVAALYTVTLTASTPMANITKMREFMRHLVRVRRHFVFDVRPRQRNSSLPPSSLLCVWAN